MSANDLTDHDRQWIAACNEAGRRFRKMMDEQPAEHAPATVRPYVPPTAMSAQERGQLRQVEAARVVARKPVGMQSKMAAGYADRLQRGSRGSGPLRGKGL